MRPLRLLPVVLVIGVVVTSFMLLPLAPRTLSLPGGVSAPVRGAVHVHTRRSDGTGTVDQIAASASRAGLSFVILTDHGDATREAERPTYQHGVLCIDAAEISTTGGHVVALGVSRSPYPLGGEPRDVVEDIARLGGMSIAAHPTSSKPSLRWRDWSVPVDGVEWLNGDSEWRNESARSLARALLTYPVRRAATLAALLDRPDEALMEWDRATASRPVVGLAGSDAHARIGISGEGDPFEPRIALHLPSYEHVFRAFSISLPGVTLGHDAASDAKVVLEAIRHGHVYSSIDGMAQPAVVSFTAHSGGVRVRAGDTLRAGHSTTFSVESNAPMGARVSLLLDGRRVADSEGPRLEHESNEPGAYRVEIHLPGAPGTPPIPWIVTNPIYVRAAETPVSERGGQVVFASRYEGGPADGWSVEKNAQSQGAIDVVPTIGGTQIKFRFALGGTDVDSPFVAVVVPAGSLAGSDRMVFNATASRPMRLSVQLRSPEGATGKRWQRSVYIDETSRALTVRFNDMTPVGAADPHPIVERVRDVLFVVDTTNTRPGSNGQIWLDDLKYGRGSDTPGK